jgi:hypothetical protein
LQENQRAPAGLSPASRAWFRQVVDEYAPSLGEIKLLEVACRARDRAEQCRAVVDKDGPSVTDRFGQVKAHPLLVEERQQRDLQRRALSSLTFEGEE